MPAIHQTAIVDSKAEIASDVEIGAYSIIGANVVIEEGVKIGPHVVVEGHTVIGQGSKLFQFCSVGAQPQDLKYRGEPSTLTIGKENIIREFVTLQPGTEGGGMKTVIGDRNLFMANSHVGHDCMIGNNNVFANSVALAGHVTVFSNVIVGGLAAIHQFSRIGDYALLSGGSMVAQDVPPYCIVQGDRAMLRGINTIGLERAKFSKDDISSIKKAYRQLFLISGKLSNKIDSLGANLLSSSSVQYLVDFINSSERGVCSSARS